MSKNYEQKSTPITPILHQMVLQAHKQGSGLNARTIADVVGKPYQTFMSELSGQEGHKLGAELILPLHHATGITWAVKTICSDAGGVFVPLKYPADSPECLVSELSKSIKEFGEFAAETAQNITDGDIPSNQLGRIVKEGEEAVEAILSMIRLARVTHEKQYGRAVK